MKFLRKIFLVGLIFGLALFYAPQVFAQNITVAQDVTIQLTTGTFTLLSSSNALDEVSVNSAGTAFTVTTNLSTGSVIITNSAGIDMGKAMNSANLGLTVCDGTTGSRLVITANATAVVTVTVTPTGAICSWESVIGATAVTSGGGGTGSLSFESSTSLPTTTTTTVGTAETTDEIGGNSLTDVDSADFLAALTKSRIYRVAQMMYDNDTYDFADGLFRPSSKIDVDFALRMALGVSGNGCGSSNPDALACAASAASLGFISETPEKMTRVKYYEILLKAMGIPLVDPSSITSYDLCIDVKANSPYAQIIGTARAYNIATRFAGGRCYPDATFPRFSAAIYAARGINARARMRYGGLHRDVIVEVRENGFTPASFTINAKDIVRFVNRRVDGGLVWPASAVHPTHLDLPGFDVKRGLKYREFYFYTFKEPGAWKYHDHLHPGFTGTVTVE